jgi:hypothetical protein
LPGNTELIAIEGAEKGAEIAKTQATSASDGFVEDLLPMVPDSGRGSTPA